MVKVVIGANFGDEGKGLMTDYFAGEMGGHGVVILSNGGPQRGHTVIKDGKRHVFHHFGSGTFRGYDTYCPRQFILNPAIYIPEKYELKYKFGVDPWLYHDPECPVTTPWDMMANQIIELAREKPHGSCGLGIWETQQRHKEIQLNYENATDKHLHDDIKDYYRNRFEKLGISDFHGYEDVFFHDDGIEYHFAADCDNMFRDSFTHCLEDITSYSEIIFENGQGLLLDEDNKHFYPHVTASKTGLYNPAEMIKELSLNDKVEVCYVTRSYTTRHGNGSLPHEVNKKEEISESIGPDITNISNDWQGTLRYGRIDFIELLERIGYDFINNRPCDAVFSIAVTHLNEYAPEWAEKYGYYLSYNENEIIKRGPI